MYRRFVTYFRQKVFDIVDWGEKSSEMNSDQFVPKVCRILSDPSIGVGYEVKDFRQRNIQSLWAGYGYISRLTLEPADATFTPNVNTVIAKCVRPRRGETGISHERKLKSYQVEAEFYRVMAPRLLETPDTVQGLFGIPTPYHVESDGNDALFLLSDLSPDYPSSPGGFSFQEACAPLGWLAAFHACFWEQTPSPGVWEEGSYWHFQTRHDEWQSMGRSWKRLQQAAPAIDQRLRGCFRDGSLPPAPQTFAHRTCVHGDPKDANIMTSRDKTKIAFYDFQYVGGGYGSRDLVYFFCAAMDSDAVEHHEEELLRLYHEQLCAKLADPTSFPFEMLLQQFELCLLDYVRFMAGWGMWGNSSWASKRAESILNRIDQGKLLTQEEYFDLIYELYPVN